MAIPCLKGLTIKGRQVAKLKPTVIATNIIDGKLQIIEKSKFENTQISTISVGEEIKYFSVIIPHALTVANDYKQLRVYLEKYSSPLNKQTNKQTKNNNNSETCLSKKKLYPTKQTTADRFSTSSLQIFIQGWVFQ